MSKQTILVYSLCATLALLSTSGAASAACPIAGTWHLFAMQGTTPAIKSAIAQVKNGANQTTNIRVFPKTGSPFNNETATVIKCVLAIKANGNFTGPCSAYTANVANPVTPNVSGKLTMSACNFTGTLNVQGDPTPLLFKAGHINDKSGSAIGTQGNDSVFHFTLVKN
jgi:hypothetical protein